MTKTQIASEMTREECIESLSLLDWEYYVSLFFATQEEHDEFRGEYSHDDHEVYIGETASLEDLQNLCRDNFDNVK